MLGGEEVGPALRRCAALCLLRVVGRPGEAGRRARSRRPRDRRARACPATGLGRPPCSGQLEVLREGRCSQEGAPLQVRCHDHRHRRRWRRESRLPSESSASMRTPNGSPRARAARTARRWPAAARSPFAGRPTRGTVTRRETTRRRPVLGGPATGAPRCPALRSPSSGTGLPVQGCRLASRAPSARCRRQALPWSRTKRVVYITRVNMRPRFPGAGWGHPRRTS